MNRQEAATHLHQFMRETCFFMCENLPEGEFYDDIVNQAEELTERYGKWVKQEMWCPETCTMLGEVVKFCQEELDRQIFEADPPQWFLDTTHALQILDRRLEEGTHYFD